MLRGSQLFHAVLLIFTLAGSTADRMDREGLDYCTSYKLKKCSRINASSIVPQRLPNKNMQVTKQYNDNTAIPLDALDITVSSTWHLLFNIPLISYGQ